MAKRRAVVKWSELERFEDAIDESPVANDYYGVYAIFEGGHRELRQDRYKFGDKELIYVGIVWQEHKSFRDRMLQHRQKWGVWGDEMYVKFGVVHSFANIDRQLIEDIESAFIMIYQPSENVSKKNSFTAYDFVEIVNSDPDGLFKGKIDTGKSDEIEWI